MGSRCTWIVAMLVGACGPSAPIDGGSDGSSATSGSTSTSGAPGTTRGSSTTAADTTTTGNGSATTSGTGPVATSARPTTGGSTGTGGTTRATTGGSTGPAIPCPAPPSGPTAGGGEPNVCYEPCKVEPCYDFNPATRNVGECHDGEWTCLGWDVDIGEWSDCEGSQGPSLEACDGLDNDCDGMTDEDC